MNDDSGSPHEEPETIVLVHGSWHWGGCFDKLKQILLARGFQVIAPDLASHGLDPKAYTDITSLSQYVQSIERVLDSCKRPAILIGHSIGGVALSYLGEVFPEKIKSLIYIAGFMPENGRSALDYILAHRSHPDLQEFASVIRPTEDGRGLEIDVVATDRLKAAFYADCSDDDIARVQRHLSRTTSTIPDLHVTSVSSDRWGRIPRTYIFCQRDKANPLSTQQAMGRAFPGTTTGTIDSSHSPFLSKPAELAQIIVDEIQACGHRL